MAHFAEVVDGIVTRVLVTSNNWDLGQTLQWLHANVSENLWLQTSYNNNIRTKFAGIGDEYHEDLDAFIAPKPFPSWVLNTELKIYEAPVPYPNDGKNYVWNEDILNWEEFVLPDEEDNE